MPTQAEKTTQPLHIALQDGFEGEPVVITLDGKEIYRRPDVQTDYRIGLADSVEVPFPERPATVRISLPQRGAQMEVAVAPGESPFVGVSFLDGALQVRRSERPFGYV